MILLYLLARRFLIGYLAYALPPLALVCGVVDLARLSTPDGLAFCSMVLAAWFLMTGRIVSLLVLFPIMIGIRTDLMLFVLPLLAAQLFIEDRKKWKVVLSAVACVAVYALISTTWQSHSWSTTFHFTLVQAATHPASTPPELTAEEYFTALAKGTKAALFSKVLVLFGLFTAYSAGLLWAESKDSPIGSSRGSPVAALTLVLPIFVVAHFLLFPLVGDRFFSGAAVLAAFALLASITESVQGAFSS